MVRRVFAALVISAVLALHAAGTALPRVDVLDVGQGDAILISDGRIQMLVDAGRDGAILPALGRAMPYTDRTIELLVITHPDRDHYAGLSWLLEMYRVETVLIATFSEQPFAYTQLLSVLQLRGANVQVIAMGDSVSVGEFTAEVLWPEVGYTAKDRNNESVVLSVRYREEPPLMLLTGDAYAAVERELVDLDVPQARILKAGHHGSSTSSDPAFIAHVDPEAVIFSAGRDNRYGHPAYRVVQRVRNLRLWRTDEHGTVRISTDANVRSCRIACLP